MKNKQKQLMTMTVVFSVITVIYIAIFSKTAFSQYTSFKTKVALVVILVALILAVVLSLVFGLKSNKNDTQEETTKDKKNPIFSILISLGVIALVVAGLLVLFFVLISE